MSTHVCLWTASIVIFLTIHCRALIHLLPVMIVPFWWWCSRNFCLLLQMSLNATAFAFMEILQRNWLFSDYIVHCSTSFSRKTSWFPFILRHFLAHTNSWQWWINAVSIVPLYLHKKSSLHGDIITLIPYRSPYSIRIGLHIPRAKKVKKVWESWR